jgi:hypothetical protein
VYLGQEIVMGKENQANEINRRTRLAWAAYSKLEFAFRMNLKAEQKARIHDQCILPVLTYGAETWIFTKEILNKLQVVQRAIERKLVGVTLRDRRRNDWLRHQRSNRCYQTCSKAEVGVGRTRRQKAGLVVQNADRMETMGRETTTRTAADALARRH